MNWLPTDISECKIWIDASQLTGYSYGSIINSIQNLGTAGGTFTRNTGNNLAYNNNAMNGKPAFSFGGSTSLDFSESLGQTPCTVVLVTSKPGAGGYQWQRIISSGPNYSAADYLNGGICIMPDSYTDNGVSSGTYAPLITSTSYDLVNAQAIRLGGVNTTASIFYGFVSELMVFTKKLSTAELAIIKTYLAEKWNFPVIDAVYPTSTLVLESNNQIMKYDTQASKWVNIGTYPQDLNWDLFKTHGMTMRRVPASAITQRETMLSLLHYVPDSLTSITGPQAQIIKLGATSHGKLVLAQGDINIKSIENTDQAKVVTSEGVRMIVSVNQGTDWKSFDGLSWQSINTPNLNNVSANGMTATTFNSITKDKWIDLIGSDPQTIRFGYAISDAMSVNDLQFTVDMKGAWEQQTPKIDFKALYASSSSVQIQLLSSGDYKINY